MRLGFTNLWAISGPFQTLPLRLELDSRFQESEVILIEFKRLGIILSTIILE